MRYALVALATIVMLGGCARVQEIERSGPTQLVMADAPGQARAIAYQLPGSPSEGTRPDITILRGKACELGSQRAARTSPFAITDSEYASVFQDELRRAGYRALDRLAAGARADASGTPAEFRIVAVMSGVRMNVCLPEVDAANSYDGKGEAGMTVRWQVYTASGKDVVYTATHQGYARVDEAIPAAGRELLRAAFARAIHGLLADEGFRAFMRAPAR